jgi:hypothetical protein
VENRKKKKYEKKKTGFTQCGKKNNASEIFYERRQIPAKGVSISIYYV